MTDTSGRTAAMLDQVLAACGASTPELLVLAAHDYHAMQLRQRFGAVIAAAGGSTGITRIRAKEITYKGTRVLFESIHHGGPPPRCPTFVDDFARQRPAPRPPSGYKRAGQAT